MCVRCVLGATQKEETSKKDARRKRAGIGNECLVTSLGFGLLVVAQFHRIVSGACTSKNQLPPYPIHFTMHTFDR